MRCNTVPGNGDGVFFGALQVGIKDWQLSAEATLRPCRCCNEQLQLFTGAYPFEVDGGYQKVAQWIERQRALVCQTGHGPSHFQQVVHRRKRRREVRHHPVERRALQRTHHGGHTDRAPELVWTNNKV